MGLKFSTSIGGPSDSSSRVGKGCGTVFFGLFFLVGVMFTGIILAETWKQLAGWWWPETDCTILTSEVVDTGEDQKPYRVAVRFRYERNGQVFESDRLSGGDSSTESFDRARDKAARYRPGAAATCRVSPGNPSLAVLERQLPWIAFVVPFPLIFVTIGGIGLYVTWRRSRPGGGEQAVESISQAASPGKGHKAMVFIGLVFVIVGGGIFVPMTVLPSIRFAESMMWEETPCTIVESRLRSWSTDDGTSYRADILYEYQLEGRNWASNRVVFFGFVNSGHESARDMLDRHPDGADATCWVDPRDPSRSVLERQLRPHHLIGLVPLIFVLAGAAVAFAGWRKMRSQRPGGETEIDQALSDGESVRLEPQVGPVGKVMGALLFTVIWNGIVSVFVWQVFTAWEQGRPNWFLTIFMIPFVLVGLFSIGLVGYSILALANPRPRLTIIPGRPRLGEGLRLDWRFTGRSSRLNHLRIFLEGREEATYRRGTKSYTDREVFASHDLVDTTGDWEIPRGTAELVIPEDTMHSFDGGSNKIVWEIKVEGDIARWPDVEQSFPIDIRPMRIGDF